MYMTALRCFLLGQDSVWQMVVTVHAMPLKDSHKRENKSIIIIVIIIAEELYIKTIEVATRVWEAEEGGYRIKTGILA